jgi:energy-coupling factor transporter ATP-binding protein EcfA2
MNLNKLNPWVLCTTLCFYNGVNALQESKGYVPVLDGEGYVQDYQAKPFPWFSLGLFGGLGAIAWKNRRLSGGKQVITYKPTDEIIEALRAGLLTQDDLPMALDLSRYPEFIPQEKPLEPVDLLMQEILDWDGSIVIAAVTGSGKTTLLLHTMKKLMHRHNGKIDYLIVDPKDTPKWLGFANRQGVDGKPAVIYSKYVPGKESSIQTLVDLNERLDWVRQEMDRRQEARKKGNKATTPLYLIIDEWPSLSGYIELAKSDKVISFSLEQISKKLKIIILQGREDLIRVWFISQGHQCGSLGLTGDDRNNVGIIGLASPKKIQTIEAIVSDSWLIKAKDEREELNNQFNSLRGQAYLYFSGLTGRRYIAQSPKRDKSIEDLDLFVGSSPEPEPSSPDPWEESTII